jgi:hypothetical protein
MKIASSAIAECFSVYSHTISLGNGDSVTFKLQPLSALKKIGLSAEWIQNPESAQRKTLEACVIDWSGVEYSDGSNAGKPIPYTFENLERIITMFPALLRQLNDHLVDRNKFFQSGDDEKQTENFTQPPSE